MHAGGQRPRLYTCGNDRTVRSYSIDTMQCLEEIKCGYIPILLLLAASVTRLAIVMYSSLVGIRDFAHIKRLGTPCITSSFGTHDPVKLL